MCDFVKRDLFNPMVTENFYFLNTRETEDNNQFEQICTVNAIYEQMAAIMVTDDF